MMKYSLVFVAVAVFVITAGAVSANQMQGQAGPAYVTEVASGSGCADVEEHNTCPHCGMDREKYAQLRMLITYSDGSSVGVCSIHCLVTELKVNKGKPVKSVEVADLYTKRLIDAKKATWVIGGNKKGVMARTAKWAFAKKDDAAAFAAKNGGTVATYKEALASAEKE